MFIMMGVAAHADVIGSAPTYGGTSQAVAVCYYSNLSSTRGVKFNKALTYQENGVPVTQSSNNCDALIPLESCRTVASIVSSLAHWCRAVVNTKAALRGRTEIRNGSSGVLTSETMR